MTVTVIGRGHSGTRAIAHTLYTSGVNMGGTLNQSGDLVPPDDMYEACRVISKYIDFKGGLEWDFSKLFTMQIDPAFIRLVESYLSTVLGKYENNGWKLPETTLAYPWIVKMFPEIKYIHWVRDPRDCILGGHVTDDLSDFGILYEKTEDIRLRRAISWKYQREIVKATPPPKHVISVRFEDFITEQDKTLNRISEFLSIPLSKVIVRPDSIGRYKDDDKRHMFDFFEQDMKECGYIY